MRAKWAACGVALALLLAGSTARAYPTSVVFAPTGEVKREGTVAGYAYGALAFAPRTAPGVTWFGAEVGVLPRTPYGRSGVAFGGMEIGVDLLNADLLGTPAAYVKPLFNVKVQLLTEYRWVPNVAVGILGVAPFQAPRSLNLLYASLTKSIDRGQQHYGRVTLGLTWAANESRNGVGINGQAAPVFLGTWPFSRSSRFAVLAGYQTPAFGPVSFAIDYLGGVSEVGSTNAAMNLSLLKQVTWGVGGWFNNDTQAPAAGCFTYLYVELDAGRLFGAAR